MDYDENDIEDFEEFVEYYNLDEPYCNIDDYDDDCDNMIDELYF